MEFTPYSNMLLREGPAWTDEPSPALEALIARHMRYLQQLRETGKTLASGSVKDGSDLHGERPHITTMLLFRLR